MKASNSLGGKQKSLNHPSSIFQIPFSFLKHTNISKQCGCYIVPA
jgi:hypothetical protein